MAVCDQIIDPGAWKSAMAMTKGWPETSLRSQYRFFSLERSGDPMGLTGGR
jgi:hypothetical protein